MNMSRRQWRTEEPGMLQSGQFQRIQHDLVTEQQLSVLILTPLSGMPLS